MIGEVVNVARRARRFAGNSDSVRQVALTYLSSIPFRLHLRRLWPGTYLSYGPDRYTINRDRYRAQGGTGRPWDTSGFLHNNGIKNGGDLGRWYFLHLVCDQILEEGLSGDIAELGVYKGNTAVLLAALAGRLGTKAYLLDTYKGFAAIDLNGIDAKHRLKFADTSVEAVRALVNEPAAEFVAGYFPASADQIPEGASFVLVHLDCDLYAPMKAGLEYFYPRLVPGGFLIIHDYLSLYWPGAKKAVDEFLADKTERLVPVPDKSGTAVIRKIAQ